MDPVVVAAIGVGQAGVIRLPGGDEGLVVPQVKGCVKVSQ